MKQIFNKYIIIILGFYAFWTLGVPFIFQEVLPHFCENISTNSDFTVEVNEPKLILTPIPNAKFKADSIRITSKKAKDFTNIENFETTIRILPLLSGHIHINNIKISDISALSVLKKDLELDKDFMSKLKKTKVSVDKVNIDNLSISLKQPNIKAPVIYNAKDIYFKRTSSALDLNITSSLSVKDTISKANIQLYLPQNNSIKKSIVNVTFDSFDISLIADYLRQYLPQDLVDIKGIINAKVDKQTLNLTLNNCEIIMKDSAKSIIFPDELNIISKFNITNKIINFENIDINSKNISASLKGNILNYLDKSLTTINFNVRLDKSRVEDIISMLPPIIAEEFNVYKLKHYKFYGNAIGNFNIKGNILEPEVYGDVFINDGVLIKPIKNAAGAVVKLDFAGKYLNFDAEVPAGDKEKVWVKGGVELYNVKYADMHIWSTKNVNLETAEEKIIPVHEILNFLIGPVPIMDIKGNGNIDINVKGNRKNPHVWGALNVNNVTTYFNEIPDLILTKANAVLNFNDQNAEFKMSDGFVNNKPINISGTCNLYGKFDFDVKSSTIDIGYLYKALQTSTMIEEIKSILPKSDYCKGPATLSLKVFGNILDIYDIQFNKNLFSKGEIKLNDNEFELSGIKLNNTYGFIKFDGMNIQTEIDGQINKSPFNAKGFVKNNIADMKISIPQLNVNDILTLADDIKNDFGNVFLEVSAAYKGKVDEIEYNKINFNAKILGTALNNKLKLSKGTIALNNNKLRISDVSGNVADSKNSFNVNLNADNLFSNMKVNGFVQLKSFDLDILNNLQNYSLLKDYLKDFKFEKGKINLNCKVNNNLINAYSDLGGIIFTYKPMEIPVKVINGSLIIKNNTLKLNKLNLLLDEMPVFVDGTINDILKKQIFNIYINSKPKQEFIDKYINKNQIYPIKIKGDIVYTLKLKGVKDNFDVKADVNMPQDSSIYHLGATVGDVENAIVLNLDTKIIKQNILKIKEFSYDKIVSSLGKKETRLNMLKAKGGIEIYKDDLVFHDLYVKTQNPTDARIFNIIFRKPNIKQGQFTSDLRFNGKLSNPRLVGDFHIFETDIPFLDTTMKNINFKFKDKTIDLYSKGEILNNDISVKAVLRNKLSQPYYIEKADLYTKVLDLNNLIEKLKLSQLEASNSFDSFDGTNFSAIIREANLNADNIYLRNIVAKDFSAQMSVNDKKILNVSNFKFNIADGLLKGSFNYNLSNNGTALNLTAKDINANDITYALFDLDNQIYGNLTGNIKLFCSGTDFENCMKTLSGKTEFNVTDGKMPKLGSLEYLLKAGNLLKGGLTGISINSMIDIITPLKTGEFSDIYGTIDIKDGIAEDIEIVTKGKDLSLFLSGNYNFSNSEAEMEVLGMLSRKISTMFGPIGNLSLNTLFNAIPGIDLSKNTSLLEKINKIPGIELSSKAYRKFIAEIKGNINGDNYVTSFKWIN